MKLIKPNVEILEQSPGLRGVHEAICQAAATCYKSAPKTGEKAEDFVDALIKNGHLAMLEFGTVFLEIPNLGVEGAPKNCAALWTFFKENPYSACIEFPQYDPYVLLVTTNYRVLVETGILEVLKYMCEPSQFHIQRYTVRFIASVGVGREFTRHRAFSFAQESTRYCNYSKDKFNNQVTFIIPSWSTTIKEGEYNRPLDASEAEDKDYIFGYSCWMAECFYKDMIEAKASPQEAREALPLSTKSELCMCGFQDSWTHFFDLRLRGTTGAPHPDAKYCATLLHNKFKERGIEL